MLSQLYLKKLLPFFCLIFIAQASMAQLCQGSLGDPVVNITFGSGTNPGPPLGGNTTNMSFLYSDCPNDGQYTIINQTHDCFGATWHTLQSDHTGDANGYFMLVNASLQPSDFYIDTVRALCPGTTYEFAAWILNILKQSSCNGMGIEPNITFRIEKPDGTVLQTYTTGLIPGSSSPQWKQYGFYFKTPDVVSTVVLRMTNNSTGGCGNDLALDDITFRPCGPKINTVIDGDSQTVSKNICTGIAADFTFSTATLSPGFINPGYQWQLSNDDGTSWQDIAGATAATLSRHFTTDLPVGAYLFRLTVAEAANIAISTCRVASNLLTITVNAHPKPVASSNSPVCAGNGLILSAVDGATYSWTGPGNFTASGAPFTISNSTAANSGKYYVTVTSAAGCTSVDSTIATVNVNPVATVSSNIAICSGNSTTLNAGGGISYTWSPAAGLSNTAIANPLASPADSTTYTVQVFNELNCFDTASVTVNVLSTPTANAGPDKQITQGQSIQLDGAATGGVLSYYWTPNVYIDNPNVLQPVVSPNSDTTYTLHVISSIGCGSAMDDVFVRVFKKVIIPNAFSPNHDGINDTWNIVALNTYPESDISVFNRYGQVIFKSTGYNKPWDGTYNGNPMPVGTYYYVIDLKSGAPKLSGWVMLLK